MNKKIDDRIDEVNVKIDTRIDEVKKQNDGVKTEVKELKEMLERVGWSNQVAG